MSARKTSEYKTSFSFFTFSEVIIYLICSLLQNIHRFAAEIIKMCVMDPKMVLTFKYLKKIAFQYTFVPRPLREEYLEMYYIQMKWMGHFIAY